MTIWRVYCRPLGQHGTEYLAGSFLTEQEAQRQARAAEAAGEWARVVAEVGEPDPEERA